MTCRTTLVAAVLAMYAISATPARAQTPGADPGKSDATEQDQKPGAATPAAPVAEPPPPPAPPVDTASPPITEEFVKQPQFAMFGKFKVTLLNFIEFDAFHDSTQAYVDSYAGNTALPRSGYAADHGRTNFTARNTQFGLAVDAPPLWGMTAGGHCRLDFNGQQVGNPPFNGANTTTEYTFATSATTRLFHCYGTLKTPYVDVLSGLTYTLFGNQPYFFPPSLSFLGIPGEVFVRTVQFRLSHQFPTSHADLFVGVAAARPPQRDAEIPDAVGAIRVLFNDLKGARTIGSIGTKIDTAAIGVSGVYREFHVQENVTTPTTYNKAHGSGFSLDAFIPVIPASNMSKVGNSLSLLGSYARGSGIADMWLFTTGNAPAQTRPLDPMAPAGTAAQPFDLDPGYGRYDANNVFHTINWTSYLLGAQYYLPGPGNIWLYGNYTHLESDNLASLLPAPAAGALSTVFTKESFAAGGLFWAIVPNFEIGLEYAWLQQQFLDGGKQSNNRVSFASYYVF